MANMRYPLNQSPLYKIVGLGRLEKVLSIDLDSLPRLLSSDNYRVWKNEREREIQQPIRWLAQVHNRIGHLLSRIELPDYLFSQKGRSYIDNAKQHCNAYPLAKTDITKFYTSTTRSMVRKMFVDVFKCAGDVSEILADICCYRQEHLPTGSALSGRVAFFSALPMFNNIEKLALETGSRMTVYVDDITVSGPLVTKKLISDVRGLVRQHGLKTKRAKTKTFAQNSVKSVTGVIVVQNQVRLPNSRHKRIWDTLQSLKEVAPNKREELLRSLRGRLQEAKQIKNIDGVASIT
jgi:hypothetical protein